MTTSSSHSVKPAEPELHPNSAPSVVPTSYKTMYFNPIAAPHSDATIKYKIDNGDWYVYNPTTGFFIISANATLYAKAEKTDMATSDIHQSSHTVNSPDPNLVPGEDLLDLDDDGIHDPWEAYHFPGGSVNGTGDADADGVIDYLEYITGTDPNDSGSHKEAGIHYEYDEMGRMTSSYVIP